MRENQLLAPHRVGRPKTKAHEGTITTPAVDQRWGTDMPQTVTLRDGPAYVFVAVDHGNTECVGIHADRSGNRFQALEPIRQGVRHHFGAIAEGLAAGLQLRFATPPRPWIELHGPWAVRQRRRRYFQDEIAFLGIASSPSFVREPEGNGVAERFIRTLKENLLWGRSFETIEELRQALIDFADRYNHPTTIGCSLGTATKRLTKSELANVKLTCPWPRNEAQTVVSRTGCCT
jgi:transposase InsO family protein